MADDLKVKKGYAAPLEGVVGREIAGVLNMAFMMIGLKMLTGLGMKMAHKLGGPSIGAKPAPGANPALKGPAMPHMSAPRPKGMMDS